MSLSPDEKVLIHNSFLEPEWPGYWWYITQSAEMLIELLYEMKHAEIIGRSFTTLKHQIAAS